MLRDKFFEFLMRLKSRLINTFLARRKNTTQNTKILFITSKNRISGSQIFPFYFNQVDLYKKFNIFLNEIDIDIARKRGVSKYSDVSFVFFQPWFDISESNLAELFGTIKRDIPGASLIFLDSYAPVDLRLAEKVNAHIDVYVKKHVFRDRSRYGVPTCGDTNLTDYYLGLYGLQGDVTNFTIPDGFLRKLVVGPSFFTSSLMLPFFKSNNKFVISPKSIDVHARLGGAGDGWYGTMRTHALKALSEIPSISVVKGTGVKMPKYLAELKQSKICFSPFGYGEVCWRDYEAVMCGALLVKPAMDHVETYPDIFIPYVTYIPIKWDFSDLKDKILYYLNNDEEREKIIQTAFIKLQSYACSNEFLLFVENIMNKSQKQE